jgi:hypothetical protein
VAKHDSIADRTATECMKKVLSLPEVQNVNYMPASKPLELATNVKRSWVAKIHR